MKKSTQFNAKNFTHEKASSLKEQALLIALIFGAEIATLI